MTVWRLEREASQTYEDALFDSRIQDTFNPFGTYAEARIDDFQGTKFDNYPYGTRVDLYFADEEQIDALLDVESGETLEITGTRQAQLLRNDGTVKIGGSGKLQLGGDGFQNRFTGYVVERREGNNAGADELNIVLHTYDQFLRRNRVSSDQSGSTISDALESIITNDVDAVAFDASLVSVVDDQTLTQSYRGDKVENVLQSLSFKSGDEEFGVNSDGTFFFQPREESRAPRDIDNSQWFDYDIPEVGNEAINEVTVFYNDGDESVTVDAGDLKLDLEENLNLDGPGTQSAEITREDITELDDARTVGEQYLRFRNTTLTGQVMSYGLNSAEPGDVINIVIDERGIDDDFLIAENDMEWGIDQNALTVVEKRGDQDDILIRLNDAVDRREDQAKNRDGVNNRVTSTSMTALIGVSGSIDPSGSDISSSADRFVNDGFVLVRDGWIGEGNLDIATLRVGDDASNLSRSNSSLENQTESVAVSESLDGSKGVTYSGSISQTTVREAGLFDSSDNMICRVVFPDNTLSGSTSVEISLTVSNDAEVSNAVVTNDGQEAVRDVIANNSPNLPTQYAYGSDGTAPSESDTSLGNNVTTEDLTAVLVQSANTTTTLDEIVSISETVAAEVGTDSIDLLQSGFTQDDQTAFSLGSNNGVAHFTNQDGYAEGTYTLFDAVGEWQEWEFTTVYPILNLDLAFRFRGEATGSDPLSLEISINDTTIASSYETGSTLDWEFVGRASSQAGDTSTLPTGTHTLRIEAVESGADDVRVDVVDPYDEAYTYDFDNDLDGTQGSLSGPEHYPDQVEVEFENVMTRRELDEATATQTWNNTDNNQFIALSNDGGNTYQTTNNSASASHMFGDTSTQIRTKIGLSRYGSQGSTPTSGVNGQSMSSHSLTANVDAVAPNDIRSVNVQSIVAPNTILGETLREAGELDSSSNLLTRSVFAEWVVESNQRILSSEVFRWAND